MTTVDDAITRLKIVRAAVEGQDPTELAVTEAYTAVTGCLEAILEETAESESREGKMIFALAMNARTLEVVLPTLNAIMDDESPAVHSIFSVFANTVELLVELYEDDRPEINDWVATGVDNGWVSDPWCAVHDGPPISEEEQSEIAAHDGDPDVICIPALRLMP